jgi:anti-sigma B factor antagonist
MANNASSLLVALVDHAAIVKVNGRANFTTSISFKRLVGELRQRGFESFLLDLSECVTMDSTFLGVLAGTALKLSEPPGQAPGHHTPAPAHPCTHLRLVNPNQRVADLLDNLGVSDLFRTVRWDSAAVTAEQLAPAAEVQASPEELSRTCLEAHQLLMELNPENIAKFKDVTQFLTEDLKKLNGESKAGDPPPGPGPSMEPVTTKAGQE